MRKSGHDFQARREFEQLLNRSSLSDKKLWVNCPKCGCGDKQARDPFESRKCVAGHWLPNSERLGYQ